MKKFFLFFREIMLASVWPVLFIASFFWAFETPKPVIGLLILLASLLLQSIVTSGWLRSSKGCNHAGRFNWSYFNEFAGYKYPCWGDYGLIILIANIVFNLLKVATIICIAIFIAFKFSVNNLSSTSLIIMAFVSVAIMLGMSKRRLYDYRMLRAYLALIILISLNLLVYLCHGTQLIWIPLIIAFTIAGYSGFNELKEVLRLKLNWNKIVFFAFLVTGCISTIVQYSIQIGNFFTEIFTWIKNAPHQFMEFVLKPSTLPWAISLLALLVAAILFIVGVAIIGEMNVKKEAKMLKKAEEKKAEEKKEKEDAITRRLTDLMKYGCGKYPDLDWGFDDIWFIFENLSKLDMKNQHTAHLLAWGLSRTDLFKVIIVNVSDKKKQIVFHTKSGEIFELYNELYVRSYDDAVLKGLEQAIEKLSRDLNQKSLKDYKGVKELKGIIGQRCQNFPGNFLVKLSNIK